MTDFRALCAELHAAFNTYAVDMKHHDLLERARAALTEPKPPSLKEQALELVRKIEGAELPWALSELSVVRRALEQLDD
jgi:hypothetical protein